MRNFIVATLVAALAACAPSAEAPAPDAARSDDDRDAVRVSLTRALSRSPEHLRTRELADGKKHVHLTGGFQHHTMLVRDDAGVARHCLSDLAEALRLVDQGEAAR